MSDYEVDTLLGCGSFGKVKLARRKKDKAVLCVKTMKKAAIIESKQTDHIINECNILSQLNHPMIVMCPLIQVSFEGICQDPKYLHIFMEYIPGGELFTHLREEGSFDPAKAK